MAMNKKEQAAFAELQEQLRIAKAFRFTEPVPADVPIPETCSSKLAKGWMHNAYSRRVERACSSSASHSFGRDDKAESQRPCRLYSTRLLALRAMRHEVEQRFAKELADIDLQIEHEVKQPTNARTAP